MKYEQYDFDMAIMDYADHLIASYNNRNGATDANSVGKFNIEFKRGSKFLKVISVNHGSHSAHSFICVKPDGKFKYGDILKSAGWAAPAKNFARGNVLETDSYKNLSWTGV